MQIGAVKSLSLDAGHRFSKFVVPTIRLLEGLGVEGDAHLGETVQHRSRVVANPSAPNLRQVHLIAGELLDDLAKAGFSVDPGDLGENILTSGVDLLGLGTDTLLEFSDGATVRVTGLRNPCKQIEAFQKGLLAAVLDKDDDGNVVRKAGVMGVVVSSGSVAVGDRFAIKPAKGPHRALAPV